jgi:transcriptional repressor NrdR
VQCPVCDHPDTKVVDARNLRDEPVKRRRRECTECGRRFTTYERIEDLMPVVVKQDGRREVFDPVKVLAGLQKACQKRPVSADAIAAAVRRIEQRVVDSGEREFPSERIGAACVDELRALDPVAWLRFTSVYLKFDTIEQFRTALDEIDDKAAEDG